MTIDMLRHESIRETVMHATAIHQETIRADGAQRWIAQARRAVSRAAQVAEAATEAATANRHAAEAWDALATQAAKHAGACRHGAALADRTRRRWTRER